MPFSFSATVAFAFPGNVKLFLDAGWEMFVLGGLGVCVCGALRTPCVCVCLFVCFPDVRMYFMTSQEAMKPPVQHQMGEACIRGRLQRERDCIVTVSINNSITISFRLDLWGYERWHMHGNYHMGHGLPPFGVTIIKNIKHMITLLYCQA